MRQLLRMLAEGCHSELEIWAVGRIFDDPRLPRSVAQHPVTFGSYVFYLDPGPLPGISTAYWGPQVKFGLPQPALNVNMDTWTNVESLTFRYQPQDSSLPIVFIQDPTTHAPIPIPIPPITPLNPPLGIVVPPPAKIDKLEGTAKLSPGLTF